GDKIVYHSVSDYLLNELPVALDSLYSWDFG
ncbi:hypothetical protein SP305906_0001, partial [Streptococcus pneumoniae CDC3059-06]